jgi:hypothetical protein
LTNFIQSSATNSVPTINTGPISGTVDNGIFNVSVSDSFVPCGSADYCGEATPFKNDQDFQQFVNQYVSDPMASNSLPMKAMPAVAQQTMSQPNMAQQALPQQTMSMQTAIPANTMMYQPAPDYSGTNNQVQGVD